MTAYETLQTAIKNDIPVVAEVKLYNGEQRLRVGPVANLTHTHVTFYDIGKGFRTAPIQLVGRIKLDHASKARFQPIFDKMKEVREGQK